MDRLRPGGDTRSSPAPPVRPVTQVEPPSAPSRPGEPSWKPLVLVVQTQAGIARHPLRRPRLIVGRGDDCDIVVADATVSRRHLVLETDGGVLRFHDLGGTNIPLLDGTPTTAGELRPGASLVLGLTCLVVETEPIGEGTRLVDAAPRHDRRTHVPTPQDRSAVDAIPALSALRWRPLHGPDFVAELAPRLLAAARAICAHDAGMICVRASGSTATVLAAEPSEPDAFPVPAEALDPVTETLSITTEGFGERLIVPLGSDTVLVLGDPAAGAPTGEALLALAAEFGLFAADALEDAQRRTAERRELDTLRHTHSAPGRAVRASSRLAETRSIVIEAANQGLDLQISGEEGCEAEDVARYYHVHSPHRSGPFVPCYARLLSRGRMAQELAPSDSVQEGGGSCAVRAAGGTLFVDSPETLGANMQLQLAELVQANRRGPAEARFQLVMSLIRDDADPPALQPKLAELVDACAACTIPPLRSHPADAVALADVILEHLGPNSAGLPRTLTDAAERVLLAYRWPGNAAQHRRVFEIAAARAGTEPIDVVHFPEELRETSLGTQPFQTLEEVENEHILNVLRLSGGNRRKAARRLGIAYSTMFARLARLGH